MMILTPSWWLQSYWNVYPQYKEAMIHAINASNMAAYNYLYNYIAKECELGNS